MRIFRRGSPCVRDSPECHQLSKSFVLRSGRIEVHYFSRPLFLLRIPLVSFRIQITSRLIFLPLTSQLQIHFYVSSFSHLPPLPLTSLFFFLKVASRDRILSVRRTTDTYSSVLFTTQSILRDVGTPISAVSTLFFLLFAVPCLRIHISPLYFIFSTFVSLSISVIFYRYSDSTLLSCYIILKNSAFFFPSTVPFAYKFVIFFVFICLSGDFYMI